MFYCGESHIIWKLLIWPGLTVQFRDTKYVCIVVQLQPSSISRIFHLPELKLCRQWTLSPYCPFPPPTPNRGLETERLRFRLHPPRHHSWQSWPWLEVTLGVVWQRRDLPAAGGVGMLPFLPVRQMTNPWGIEKHLSFPSEHQSDQPLCNNMKDVPTVKVSIVPDTHQIHLNFCEQPDEMDTVVPSPLFNGSGN